MFIEERHQAILDIVNTEGRISINDIQKRFNISVESARRDLRILEKKNLIKRTHGGAIPMKQIGFSKPPKMTCKDITQIKPNYYAISMKAVSMINDGDVIFITSATVGYFIAQNIPSDINIRAVTNSIIIAEELRKKDNIKVILLGGEMDNKGNCYDSIAIETIKRLRFDKCFLTAACISASFGLSIQKTKAINFWNAIINSSKQSIGLFPHEKIGFDSIVSICPSNKLNTLITDSNASEEDLNQFEEQGIDVIVVDKADIATTSSN